GGRLLTLTHTEGRDAPMAAEALRRLREIIYSLDAEQEITLNAAVARWRFEVLERCNKAGAAFHWRWREPGRDICLPPRHYLNITAMLREALSNIFRHAPGACADFDLRVEDGVLHIHICNDGVPEPEGAVAPGKGLRNMRVRAGELDGEFSYTCRKGRFCICLSIPVGAQEEGNDA
ncbi:MAG: hypothetical protein Q9M29_04870, partial [Mariprofundaceae bacterium]|nr:hypothetical protein [Mariprofundaceae bacterium]